jgi:hypothetical protein
MEQHPSREANISSASNEISGIYATRWFITALTKTPLVPKEHTDTMSVSGQNAEFIVLTPVVRILTNRA